MASGAISTRVILERRVRWNHFGGAGGRSFFRGLADRLLGGGGGRSFFRGRSIMEL